MKDHYIISGESNSDILKIWDLRKFKKHCAENSFNILKQEFVPKDLAKRSTKVRKNISKIPYTGFTYYTSELSQYHKQMKKNMMKTQGLGLLESEYYESNPEINKESFYHITQINQEDPLAIKIREYTENKAKGYSSLSIVPDKNLLLANSINNSLYLFNANKLDLEAPIEFTGHKVSYYCKLLLIS